VLNRGDDGAEADQLYVHLMDRLAALNADHGGTFKAVLTIIVDFEHDNERARRQMTTRQKSLARRRWKGATS
jgi:hypothetical protein